MSATLIIETAHVRRTVENVAAWYAEVELDVGEYPVEALGIGYLRAARVPGVIVGEHFPPLFDAGVDHVGRVDRVGGATVYVLHLPDKCDDPETGSYGAAGRERFNEANVGRARVEVRPMETPGRNGEPSFREYDL